MAWYPGNPYYFLLLLLIPILGSLLYGFRKWKKHKRAEFADSKFHEILFEKENRFSLFFPFLYLLATTFLVLSIVDFIYGSEEITTKQKVSNFIFMLDVSNSMNAEDVEPDRLTQAKNLIINSLQDLKNDRVGLVIFAGEATSVMPLTTDYAAAENYLEGIQTSTLQVQGTDFLAAMKVAVSKFSHVSKGARKIILISDGEDNEGNTNAAIRLAKEEGIMVTTVGIGTKQGAPVPYYEAGQLLGYKTDLDGETIISKRETSALKDIASQTGGMYIDGNSLEIAIHKILDGIHSNNTAISQTIKSYSGIHYYQYSLALSLFLFLLIYLFNPKRDFNL